MDITNISKTMQQEAYLLLHSMGKHQHSVYLEVQKICTDLATASTKIFGRDHY